LSGVQQKDNGTPGRASSDRVEEKEEVKKENDRKFENAIVREARDEMTIKVGQIRQRTRVDFSFSSRVDTNSIHE